jgi:seryl-tRNA(Sec) selenium transferase
MGWVKFLQDWNNKKEREDKKKQLEKPTQLAARFQESNDEEQRWLRAELNELRALLASAVDKYGTNGVLELDSTHILIHKNQNIHISSKRLFSFMYEISYSEILDGGK